MKYSVYRHILEYYGNKTDAFGNLCFKKINDIDMRKALSRDKEKTTIIPAYDKPIHVSRINILSSYFYACIYVYCLFKENRNKELYRFLIHGLVYHMQE